MTATAIRSSILAIAAALLVVVPARAQESTASIAGRVADLQGTALPGATVHVTSPEAAVDFTMVTDVNGDYFFGRLPHAGYHSTFELPGYETRSRSLTLSGGEAARVAVATVTATPDMNCPPGHWHWLEDVSAGYAFTRNSATGTSFPAGWTLGAAGSEPAHTFSWVGELSGNYRAGGTDEALAPNSTISVLGGARKSYRIGRTTASGQLLGGVSRIHDSSIDRSTTSYAFALQPGVSIAVGLKRFYRWSLHDDVDARLFPFAADGAAGGLGLRFAAGVAYSIPRFLCI